LGEGDREMNIQDPEWNYPIYLEPTFDEIAALAGTNWDTVRIVVLLDPTTSPGTPTKLCLASGYGNTHSSIVRMLTKHMGRSPYTDTFILYHEGGRALLNLEDVSGNERAEYSEWSKYFSTEHLDVLRDLVRESNLVL
jgi:hypothetical protein